MAAIYPQSWSTVPPSTSPWSLECISSGVSRGTLKLSSLYGTDSTTKHLLIGRDSDTCPIEISSPLASRVHAVLAFKNLSNSTANVLLLPHLRDLNSSHGTFLNFKATRLPDGAYVEVYDGDIVQFGGDVEKRKYYVVHGPVGRSDVPNERRGVVKVEDREKGKAVQVIEELRGLAASAAAAGGGTAGIPGIPKELTKGQLKLNDKLAQKKAKVASLVLEMDRIECKRGEATGELSAGQESTLARNGEMVEKLGREVEEMEKRVEGMREVEEKGGEGEEERRRRRNAGEEEEEGEGEADQADVDFYDRTAVKKERSALDTNEALSAAEVLAVLTDQEGKIAANEDLLATAERKAAINAPREGDDELDAYERTLKVAEILEDQAGIRKTIEEAGKEKARAEKLLDVIDGEWRVRREEEGERAREAAAAAAAAATTTEKRREEAREKGRAAEARAAEAAAVRPGSENGSESLGGPSPPPPRAPAATLGPSAAMLPPPPSRPKPSPSPSAAKVAAVKGPTLPPPSLPPSQPRKKRPAPTPPSPPPSAKKPTTQPSAVARTGEEGNDDTWKPPEGQDGSGRTKLNDKFKGRY